MEIERYKEKIRKRKKQMQTGINARHILLEFPDVETLRIKYLDKRLDLSPHVALNKII